nr:MAG TPA: hypothetical protein [Caudoviricetes sp.]
MARTHLNLVIILKSIKYWLKQHSKQNSTKINRHFMCGMISVFNEYWQKIKPIKIP